MYTISFQRTFCEVLDRFETATDLSKVSELYHDTEYLLYMIVKIAKKFFELPVEPILGLLRRDDMPMLRANLREARPRSAIKGLR